MPTPRRWLPVVLGPTLLVFARMLALGQGDDLARELPRIPPTEPEAALGQTQHFRAVSRGDLRRAVGRTVYDQHLPSDAGGT